MLISMPFRAGLVFSLGYDFLFKSILGQCERFKIYLSTLCVCSSLSYFIHRYSSVNLLIIGNGRSKSVVSRVSVQGVKSLGRHFACLCRGFEFYEVKQKKFCYYFSKRKWKYFYTFYHFYSEKSSKRAK